ncbi:MAG: undecaprenyl-phosphate glucose phosphotransferase [Chitinophagia bacterium]|nr:undecaprenyl-phosphate glucose phosphotransferase [Chitinophagia bacterium]
MAKKFSYNIDLQYFSYPFFFLSVVLWFVMSIFSKIYFEKRSNKFAEEMVQMIYHSILFIVSLSSVLFFLNLNHKFPSKFVLVFANILTFLAILSKYAIRKKIHAYLNKGIFYDQVLLVGSTKAAEEFIDAVKKYYYYGYKCIGYIDDQDKLKKECAYLGNLNDLHTILRTTQIDEVFIALPTGENEKIQNCIAICDGLYVKVRILPNLSEFTSSSVYINNIGLLPVVNVGDLPLDKRENRLLKRSFDIVFSLLFFILLGSFIFPLLSIIIKLSSKGPVFFKQERWGLNNKRITCYKFRSMYKESSDIDEEGNFQQAFKDDPRITLIGKILRKTNMDELPQFWNVLIGNMSVVGPRPHPTQLNIQSMELVDNYMLRHMVIPGITGLAQVNGCRGETKTTEDMQKRVNFDLYYIQRWNFWLDLQIIIQTVINIFRGDQNAY